MKREKIKGLRKIVLGSLGGLALMTFGCADMMTKEVPKTPAITNPALIEDISLETDNLVKKYEETKDIEYLKQAARGYIQIGKFDKARECARKVISENYEIGLLLYRQLDTEIPRAEEK